MEQPCRRIWTRGAKAALLEECRSGLLAGAALLEDLDPECKAKMMKVIVVNNFLTKLHTVQKTHVIAVFLLAGSAALPEVWVNFFLARARGAGRP